MVIPLGLEREHAPHCKRVLWPDGWWHSMTCESAQKNARYALEASGGNQLYAHAITFLRMRGELWRHR